MEVKTILLIGATVAFVIGILLIPIGCYFLFWKKWQHTALKVFIVSTVFSVSSIILNAIAWWVSK